MEHMVELWCVDFCLTMFFLFFGTDFESKPRYYKQGLVSLPFSAFWLPNVAFSAFLRSLSKTAYFVVYK